MVLTAAAVTGALTLAGCGAARSAGPSTTATIPPALTRQARPIGAGAVYHPPARGPVLGACRPALGARVAAHLEVFARNRVVLVAGQIGIGHPRCYGALVTLQPTGVVLVRAGARLTVGDLFASWGQPLSAHRLLSFSAGRDQTVRAYVDGRRWTGTRVRDLPLRRHAEIVLEVGPYVPPHHAYTFGPGDS